MPLCTISSFYAASCFGAPCIDKRTQKAIMVRSLVLELAALGGTNYSSNLSLLLSDTAKLRKLSPENRDAAMLKVNLNNATSAGAVIGTINQLRAQSIQYANSQDQLENMILLLTCKLGTHTGT